jgi:hypothetical protein
MAQNNHIVCIATSSVNADVFATAESDGTVKLWSISNRRKLNEFPTIYDFCGPRLALVSDLQTQVVAGSWTKGVRAYDYLTGQCVWQRRDLKYVQQVISFLSKDTSSVGVALEKGPFRLLTVQTGEDAGRVSGIRKVFPSPLSDLCLLVGKKDVQLSRRWATHLWKKPLISFAVLDAAFSNGLVAFSEAAGPVRCYDLLGEQAWCFQPKKGWHVTTVGWGGQAPRWFVVNFNYEGDGSTLLLEIDQTGTAKEISELGKHVEMAFLPNGEYLITSRGNVISTRSGEPLWSFLEYMDTGRL